MCMREGGREGRGVARCRLYHLLLHVAPGYVLSADNNRHHAPHGRTLHADARQIFHEDRRKYINPNFHFAPSPRLYGRIARAPRYRATTAFDVTAFRGLFFFLPRIIFPLRFRNSNFPDRGRKFYGRTRTSNSFTTVYVEFVVF